MLPSGELKDQPSTWYGGVHMDPKQVADDGAGAVCSLSHDHVINVADVLERIESVVDQITFVVRLLAGFSILAGLTILASSIASTRFRRMQEAVVLKTLGATRMRIVRTFSVEFSVLGLAGRRGRCGVCQPADARAAAPAGGCLPYRVGSDGDCAGGHGGAGDGDGMDCELSDSWAAAVAGAAGGVRRAGKRQQGSELPDAQLRFDRGWECTYDEVGWLCASGALPGPKPIRPQDQPRIKLGAPSFNGRTAASGAAYRGSNPWRAAKNSKTISTFPCVSWTTPHFRASLIERDVCAGSRVQAGEGTSVYGPLQVRKGRLPRAAGFDYCFSFRISSITDFDTGRWSSFSFSHAR